MRVLRRALPVAAGVVLVCLPATASADVLSRPDAIGDVARSPVGSSTYTPATATRVEGDIVSTRVSHGPHAIWVGIRFRDLSPTTNGNFHRISIISDRRSRTVEVDAFPSNWAGRAVTTNSGGQVLPCPVTHRIDYTRNKVVVKVPRRCLGRPHWVRVGIRTTVAGTVYAYADDARRTGITSRIAYGPRVRR